MKFLSLFFVLFIVSCSAGAPPHVSTADTTVDDVRFTPVSFAALTNWGGDDMRAAVPAMRLSCARILKNAPTKIMKADLPRGRTYGDWQTPCRSLVGQNFITDAQVRTFLERHFMPYAVSNGADADGLFTGYYEASLRGARTRGGVYQTPLFARPADLVMVDLGQFRDELKGQRIAGRVGDGKLKPYESRAEIVAGNWPHNDHAIVWVDSAVDAFFVQIQGSGVVQMDDGGIVRIGYAGQNGHPYYAIGRELIKRGALTKETVSMQSIRAWLEDNPAQADDVMNTNKSYVFFEEKTFGGQRGGAIGAEGLVLTPQRSLAVDRTKIPYGVPMFVDIAAPMAGTSPLQKLMVAQDTGGAIRGAVRGDVFWGYGDVAEKTAGAMKSRGRYWVLLPK